MASTLPVRFVCISDTHGLTPDLPDGDVLIHAGNLTKYGSQTELERSLLWIDRADFKAKIIVAGSQDYCLDACFGADSTIINYDKEQFIEQTCQEALQVAPTVTYLCHETKTISFEHRDGSRVKFTVFGSPYSKKKEYVSAFSYGSDEATALWSIVPLEADIVLTHTPARHHCDESLFSGSAGCAALREALWRVRPRLAVCGHEHKGRGAEVVVWDLDTPHVRFKEHYVRHLAPAAPLIRSNMPVIDLSASGLDPLCNDRAVGNLVPFAPEAQHAAVERAWALPYWRIEQLNFSPPSVHCPLFHGLGGPRYSISDQEAIIGREGRKETCIVNGAFMPFNQPISLAGSLRNNKPIVINIDFPVVVADDE